MPLDWGKSWQVGLKNVDVMTACIAKCTSLAAELCLSEAGPSFAASLCCTCACMQEWPISCSLGAAMGHTAGLAGLFLYAVVQRRSSQV